MREGPLLRTVAARPAAALALAGLGLAAIGFASLAEPPPRLVWNASASAPLGLYWISRSAPVRGDLVLAELPPDARRLAAERGYLPAGVPLVKRVAALAGDSVCALEDAVFVDGRPVAERLAHDSLGRAPRWTGCRRLPADEIFLLMEGVPAQNTRSSSVLKSREQLARDGSEQACLRRRDGQWPAALARLRDSGWERHVSGRIHQARTPARGAAAYRPPG